MHLITSATVVATTARANDITLFPAARAAGPAGGWMEVHEADRDEPPEAKPEIVRALVTRLSDGSTLVVGDEQRRSEEILRGVLSAFGWAVAATIILGTAGGLWLSAQFLHRVDSMRLTAQRLMAGDWSRRIPLTRTSDDLTALARTFNRLFGRIEKLLQANKQVSADIAHDLRKPLASTLRRLEDARGDDASPEMMRGAIEMAIAEIEGVLKTFNALLRIGQVEAGARRAAFQPLDLAEVAREIVEAFEPAAEEEGKTIVSRSRGAASDGGRQGVADADDGQSHRQRAAPHARGSPHRGDRRANAARRLAVGRRRRARRRARRTEGDLPALLSH